MTYTEITARIAEVSSSFAVEAAAGETKKAAAGRARKLSNELGKLLKEYRAISIETHKK